MPARQEEPKMVSTLLFAAGLVSAVAVYKYVSALQRNIALARSTGLKYVVYPIHPLNNLWQLTAGLILPLVYCVFPASWLKGWILPLQREWSYRTNQEFFDWAGSESVIIVAPDDVMLYTESAEVISQVTARKEAFPKDIARYGLLTFFGQNVVSTEAAVWRMHRRVTAPSFNEKNAAHTFAEALKQTRGMLNYLFNWELETKDSTGTIRTLEHDTMVWALNIIGYVGFGLRLIFPGEKLPDDPKLAKYGSLEAPPGYDLPFAQSLGTLLERIVAILLIPGWALKTLPFEFTRMTRMAKDNYRKYMEEFLAVKKEEVRKGDHERVGMDIMGELVRSVYGEKDSKTGAKLTDDEIISNAFIMTLAGHETTANVLHFTLVHLATNPSAQRRLQKDVDELLGDSDPLTWDYERNINALLASHIGACVNETMRVMPPVTVIPKITSPSSPQSISIKGQKHVLPAGLSIAFYLTSAHRNPNQWPTQPSKRTGKPTDLEEWLPDRWYRDTFKAASANTDDHGEDETADYGGYKGSDTSAALYRPVRGSFLPFSDGPRSCLGRRLAVVELAAALPAIFQKYSVELAVDEWATDEEVARMSVEEKREVYAKAQESSRAKIAAATAIITLKFQGGEHVPVRIVKRGKERFVRDLEVV
ncbi:cytochrome P450 [Echria macrotheca]|uniref:Cytochrome P450 n=1 Tax=Echria macrotheca TaxID=438768 RepID=A0AAJ0BM98_9PEZI|nr:cytochrome P450 [Echria macrotheca]